MVTALRTDTWAARYPHWLFVCLAPVGTQQGFAPKPGCGQIYQLSNRVYNFLVDNPELRPYFYERKGYAA